MGEDAGKPVVAGDAEGALSAAEARIERSRGAVGLIAGPVLFALVLILPVDGLDGPMRRLAAVLVLSVVFWITEAIPLPATALLGPSLAVLLGVASAKEAFAPLGDPLLMLFVGSFLIAGAMSHHGLDRRLAFLILARRAIGESPGRILVAFGLISAAISMWISNTATAAMMLPVAVGVMRALEAAPDMAGRRREVSRYATGLMLVVSFGASVGGIGTPVGTPPNLIGIGMIERLAERRIPFFGWTAFAVPTLLVILPVMLGMLLVLHPAPRGALKGAADYFAAERRQLGRWRRGEIAAAASFLLAVALWITPGVLALVLGTDDPLARLVAERLPEGPVALIAASLLFVVPTDWERRRFALDWKTAARIDWGTVMLFGGGLSLGSMMFSSGLAQKLGDAVVGMNSAWSEAGFLALAIAAAIVVSEATSNTAAASMVIPVVIAVAKSRGLDPVLPALGACLGSSFGFALPVSTAPNALAYGTGVVPITRMLRAGLLLDLIGAVAIWGMLMLLRP